MKTTITRWLRKLVYAGSSTIRPHERVVIDRWSKTLSAEGQHTLAAQLESFDLVQRVSNGKLVSFYAPRSSAAGAPMFALHADDARVARVELTSSGTTKTRVRADIVLHAGRFHSLEFDRPPNVLGDRFEVVRVETFADPMSSDPKHAAAAHVAASLVLPQEHSDIVGDAPSVETNGWTVHGRSSVRRIVQPEANYLVIATHKDERALALRESDGQLVYLDDNGDFEAVAPTSFRAALRERG